MTAPAVGPHDRPPAPDTITTGGHEVHFRDYRPGDEQQMVAVYRAAFGTFYPADKPVDEAGYIRWFVEPRASHGARATLAEVDHTIVCALVGLNREIKLGGRIINGRCGGIGVATHPAFQKLGISGARSRWMRSTEPRATMVNVDTRTPVSRGNRDAPAPSSGHMGVYVNVRRPWLAAQTRKDGHPALNAIPAAAFALWANLRPRIGSGGARGVTLRTLSTFDDRFEPFLAEASAAWDVIPVRSVEFLNWRFCDPRAGAFVVRAAEADGSLLGYSVLHRIGARGHIMDLLALPGRLDVVRTLVADAVRELDRMGAAAVECWMLQEQPYAGVLRQAGFVRLRGRSARVNSEVGWHGGGIGPEEQALLNSPETRIHLVRADFDGI